MFISSSDNTTISKVMLTSLRMRSNRRLRGFRPCCCSSPQPQSLSYSARVVPFSKYDNDVRQQEAQGRGSALRET
jgi:hypothetical protein